MLCYPLEFGKSCLLRHNEMVSKVLKRQGKAKGKAVAGVEVKDRVVVRVRVIKAEGAET